ncbi:MAG: hypothetical protein RL148_1670 [Planctomycetota bacterium]|jgi:DNA recombination-dependent growth factor C
MAVFRRSGGVATFHWQGELPDPSGEEFAEALRQRRFRTIEDAASEESSSGWVTQADPTGDTFSAEDMDAGAATWLRFRTDKKVLPKKWLAIHRDAAAKAKGRPLSGRERRELKDDLADKLLPRVLPNVNLVDALVVREKKQVLLFATGKSVRETFAKLFFESFALVLEPSDPLQLALRAGLSPEMTAELERLQPVRWPVDETMRRTRRAPARSTERSGAEVATTEDDA